MSAEIELISTMGEKKSWTKPPIQMEFQVLVAFFSVHIINIPLTFFIKIYRFIVPLIKILEDTDIITHLFPLQVPMFTASGLRVRFLKVYDGSK